MKYTVLTVTKLSNHDASKYVDDEELIIVQDENGNWCKAHEFFFINSIKEFKTLDENI